MKSDKAGSASATSQQVNLWSKADFLDRARELKRRLEVWQIDGDEPVYCPREFVAFQTAIKSVFRNRVMLGEHDPQPTFTTQSLVDNSFIRNPKDPYANWITIWEFRDFVEHLGDAGDSEEAKLIRLTIERLLDSPMHTRARSQVFRDYVAGREVDSSLLEDFLKSVTDFAASHGMKQPDAPAIDADPLGATKSESKPIKSGKEERDDWLLEMRGENETPKFTQNELADMLTKKCEENGAKSGTVRRRTESQAQEDSSIKTLVISEKTNEIMGLASGGQGIRTTVEKAGETEFSVETAHKAAQLEPLLNIQAAESDPQLSKIIEAWPTLSESTRKGIVSLAVGKAAECPKDASGQST